MHESHLKANYQTNVVPACNLNTWEMEVRGSHAPGWPGLNSENLSQKNPKKKANCFHTVCETFFLLITWQKIELMHLTYMLSIHMIKEAETICAVCRSIGIFGGYAENRAEKSSLFTFQSGSRCLNVHIKTLKQTK